MRPFLQLFRPKGLFSVASGGGISRRAPGEWRRTMSLSSKLKIDPNKLMDGLTQEKLDQDPVLLEFMQSNYPEAFVYDEEQEDPVYEQLRYLGYSLEAPNSYEGKKTKQEKMAFQGYPRNIRPLETYLRDRLREEGSHNSVKMRNQHRLIPGLVYGSDPTRQILSSDRKDAEISVKTPWGFLEGEMMKYGWNFESRVYKLTVKEHRDAEGGSVQLVTPRDVNRHPIKERIYCCNFLRYHPGRPLLIPYKFINTENSPALKRDGFVVPITRKVEVLVEDGADIPEYIAVECTGVKYRETLMTDRLILPDGVRLSDRVVKRNKTRQNKWIIGVIFGGSKGKNVELAEPGKPVAAAEPAKAAAATTAAAAKS